MKVLRARQPLRKWFESQVLRGVSDLKSCLRLRVLKTLALAMTSGEGVPRRSVMSSSWCTTLRPGKSGLPSRISAKMQPIDQMSIAVEYLAKKEPHSSGARYLC